MSDQQNEYKSSVSHTDLESEIREELYATGDYAFPGCSADVRAGLQSLTLCVLVLHNGCKVVGINHGPVDRANFNAAHGREDARADAVRQVWPLLGFRLRDKLVADANKTPYNPRTDAADGGCLG